MMKFLERFIFFKGLSWQDWLFAIVLGVSIGWGINYGITTINNIDKRLAVNEELTQASLEDRFSVIKAFRVNDFYFAGDYIYLKLDMIKQRDCGNVQKVTIVFFDSKGNLRETTDIISTKTGKPLGNGAPLPVSEDWQELSYWKIKKTDLANAFYIKTEHLCPSGGAINISENDDSYGEPTILAPPSSISEIDGADQPVSTGNDIVPPPQAAKSLIVRVYGPFLLRQ